MKSARWPQILSSRPADLVITYAAGSAHGPHRDGRFALELRADGAVRLVKEVPGWTGTWTAQLAEGAWDALAGALVAAGFPDAPPLESLPPGETIRELGAATGAGRAAAELPWHDLEGPWAAVFALLDSVVRQASLDSIRSCPDRRPGLVASAVFQAP